MEKRFKDSPNIKIKRNSTNLDVTINGKKKPYTWHHHENGKDLVPVLSDIHNTTKHVGRCKDCGIGFNQIDQLMKEFFDIQRSIINDGFSIDRYLEFYLKNRLYNTLQLDIYFSTENISFKCSTFEIPWSNLESVYVELKEINVEKLVINELYSSQKILKYLKDVAKFDKGYKNGLIQIGYVEQPINYRLMCSCGSNDLGVVYLESPDDI